MDAKIMFEFTGSIHLSDDKRFGKWYSLQELSKLFILQISNSRLEMRKYILTVSPNALRPSDIELGRETRYMPNADDMTWNLLQASMHGQVKVFGIKIPSVNEAMRFANVIQSIERVFSMLGGQQPQPRLDSHASGYSSYSMVPMSHGNPANQSHTPFHHQNSLPTRQKPMPGNAQVYRDDYRTMPANFHGHDEIEQYHEYKELEPDEEVYEPMNKFEASIIEKDYDFVQRPMHQNLPETVQDNSLERQEDYEMPQKIHKKPSNEGKESENKAGCTSLNPSSLDVMGDILAESIDIGNIDKAKEIAAELAKQRVKLTVQMLCTEEEKQIIGSTINITVQVEHKQTLKPTLIKLDVSPFKTTIGNLKHMVFEKYHFPINVQRWVVGKRLPKDYENLKNLQVNTTGTVIYLYLLSAKEADAVKDANNSKVPPPKPEEAFQLPPKDYPTIVPDTAQNNGPIYERIPYQASGGSLPPPVPPRQANFEGQNPQHDPVIVGYNRQSYGASSVPQMQGIPPVFTTPQEQHPAFSYLPLYQRNKPRGTLTNPQIGPEIGPPPLPPARFIKQGWSCAQCTYVNHPTRPGCEICGSERPADYEPPANIVLDENERRRLLKEEEQERLAVELHNRTKEEERLAAVRNYETTLQAAQMNLIPNPDEFECAICYNEVGPQEGVMLRECLHSFCRECLAEHIKACENPEVTCPYNDGDVTCNEVITTQEISALLPEIDFLKYLDKSLNTAESRADNSFHCKTPNCAGWCIYEDAVNWFRCQACNKNNCLTCKAIHDDMTCKEYQDDIKRRALNDDAARKTQQMLEDMVKKGNAMNCPQCQVILQKKDGCDWVREMETQVVAANVESMENHVIQIVRKVFLLYRRSEHCFASRKDIVLSEASGIVLFGIFGFTMKAAAIQIQVSLLITAWTLLCILLSPRLVVAANSQLMSAWLRNLTRNGYDTRVRPTDTVTNVTAEIALLDIGPIKQKTMSIRSEIILRQWWNDPRLVFDNKSTFTYNGNPSGDIWIPDIYVSNARETETHSGLTDDIRVKIGPNGDVYVSIRLTVEFHCLMNFKYYPFDTQQCSMMLESYAYSDKEVRYNWKPDGPPIKFVIANLQPAEYRLRSIHGTTSTLIYTDDVFTRLNAIFDIERLLSFYVYHVYFPGVFLVAFTFCTFWIPPTSVPARVTLIVTNFLTSIFIFNGISAEIPKVPYHTPLELFTLMNIGFIIFVLVEFLFVLNSKKIAPNKVSDKFAKISQNGRCSKAGDDKQNPEDAIKCGEENEEIEDIRLTIGEHLNKGACCNFDSVARVAFPTVYIAFIVSYFAYYLHFSKINNK
eukprot:gene18848-20746_t